MEKDKNKYIFEDLEISEYLLTTDFQGCLVCCEVPVDPIACKGCKSVFCLDCAAKWKKSHNQCPKRCSTPWMFQDTKDVSVKARCPYNKQCLPMSPAEWHIHIKNCQSAPPKVLAEKRRRQAFVCKNGHPLKHWNSSYSQFIHKKCDNCTSDSYSRVVCRVCDQTYCLSCQPPACTKSQCPAGHRFFFRPKTYLSMGYICDSCGMAPLSMDVGVYDDYKCNFGVCERCHSRLPDKFPVAWTPKIDPYPWKCEIGHTLKHLRVFEKGKCQGCKQHLTLTKECRQCAGSPRFCEDCKSTYMNSLNQCRQKHDLIYINNLQVEQPEAHLAYVCVRCTKKPAVLLDPVCEYGYCQSCYYCVQSTASYSEQVINNFCPCDGRRTIIFVKDFMNEEVECSQCNSLKFCPLKCARCHKNMCYACRPPHFSDQCYQEHTLTFKDTPNKKCTACGQEETLIKKYCQTCQFAICAACNKQ